MIFFEDEEHQHFYPLTLTRPTDDLRIGIFKIHEKWLQYLDKPYFARSVRPSLKSFFNKDKKSTQEDALWVNSRFLPDSEIIPQVMRLRPGHGISYDDVQVVIKLSANESADKFNDTYPDFSGISCEPASSGFLLSRIWQLFQHNGEEIKKDYQLLMKDNSSHPTDTSNSILINPEKIYFGEHVQIDAGVILDATDGPIYVGSNANIMSGSIIKGPVAICDRAITKMGAKIYPETTIGPMCKVGGEIKNVIFQSYSNKAHEGFLGNSLIGEWCNLGADTNSSNLKNNYKPVYLKNWSTGEPYETGVDYCGSILGDHTKTGINTMLNTGTVCGVACNLFSSGFSPKIIPSFSWISDDGENINKFDKALETAGRVMAKRNIKLTEEYRVLMQHIYDNRIPC